MKKKTLNIQWNEENWTVVNDDGFGEGYPLTLCRRVCQDILGFSRGSNYKLRLRQVRTAQRANIKLEHREGRIWKWFNLKGKTETNNVFMSGWHDRLIDHLFPSQSTVYLRIIVEETP